MTGLETVEYPAAQGNQVSVFDMLDHAAHGEHFQNAIDLERRLTEVPQNASHKLISIEEGVCLFEKGDGVRVQYPCDAVVLAMGMVPNQEYANQFRDLPNFSILGTNCVYSGIAPAVESAFIAAYQLR